MVEACDKICETLVSAERCTCAVVRRVQVQCKRWQLYADDNNLTEVLDYLVGNDTISHIQSLLFEPPVSAPVVVPILEALKRVIIGIKVSASPTDRVRSFGGGPRRRSGSVRQPCLAELRPARFCRTSVS